MKVYKVKVLLPEIKREEEIMDNLKRVYRPLRKDELDDHERNY
jgi:hypothetical protein